MPKEETKKRMGPAPLALVRASLDATAAFNKFCACNNNRICSDCWVGTVKKELRYASCQDLMNAFRAAEAERELKVLTKQNKKLRARLKELK